MTHETGFRFEFCDDYEHPASSSASTIDYVLENELMAAPPDDDDGHRSSYAQLCDLFNTTFAVRCRCRSTECQSNATCLHGRNYVVSSSGTPELLLNAQRPVRDLIYECSSSCDCPHDCGNRLVQYGPRLHLRVVSVADRLDGGHQLGLASTRPIDRGAFICEYAGEVLTSVEAQRRHDAAAPDAMNYVVCLIERSTGDDGVVHRTYVDPARRGNIGRYLNHSCDPNCEVISVRVDGPIPRLGIFAKRTIAADEELTFDYAGGASDDQMFTSTSDASRVCLCGAAKCREFLPNLGYE